MNKSEIIRRLRELRRTYETEYAEDGWELSEKDVCILTDVCEALGLAEAETRYVVGDKYETYVAGPIPYTLTDAGALVATYGLPLPDGAVEVRGQNGRLRVAAFSLAPPDGAAEFVVCSESAIGQGD